MNIISREELGLHVHSTDCWISVFGEVYDITEYLRYHPGGADILLHHAGKDATSLFRTSSDLSYL